MHHQHTSIRRSLQAPCGCNGKTCASDRDKDRHRARETHNVSILTQNNERRDHGRHGHDANLYQCPVFLLSLALGLPRTALRHRVVSRFCRVQESLPCQALGVCGRHATVCHHDRHPLGPALAEVSGTASAGLPAGAQPPPPAPPPPRPRSHPYTPRTRLAPTLLPACPVAPLRASWRHCCCPAASVSRAKTSLAHLPRPVPAPALHAKNRDDAGHACSLQRQRIKGPLAHPQRPRPSLQRGSVEIPLRAGQMIRRLALGTCSAGPDCTAVEVHYPALRRRMRKDHAAPAPVAGFMRPGARRCIAHTELLRSASGMPRWRKYTSPRPRQGSLERGELLGQLRPPWSGRTRCWGIRRARPGSLPLAACLAEVAAATVWHALPAGWRPPEGRLALLLFTPLRPRCFHIAPGTTGKAHETATAHLHASCAGGRNLKGQGPQHVATFTDNRAAGGKVGFGA